MVSIMVSRALENLPHFRAEHCLHSIRLTLPARHSAYVGGSTPISVPHECKVRGKAKQEEVACSRICHDSWDPFGRHDQISAVAAT